MEIPAGRLLPPLAPAGRAEEERRPPGPARRGEQGNKPPAPSPRGEGGANTTPAAAGRGPAGSRGPTAGPPAPVPRLTGPRRGQVPVDGGVARHRQGPQP